MRDENDLPFEQLVLDSFSSFARSYDPKTIQIGGNCATNGSAPVPLLAELCYTSELGGAEWIRPQRISLHWLRRLIGQAVASQTPQPQAACQQVSARVQAASQLISLRTWVGRGTRQPDDGQKNP